MHSSDHTPSQCQTTQSSGQATQSESRFEAWPDLHMHEEFDLSSTVSAQPPGNDVVELLGSDEEVNDGSQSSGDEYDRHISTKQVISILPSIINDLTEDGQEYGPLEEPGEIEGTVEE